MALVEESPNLTSAQEACHPAVVDTTELRWFADGPLSPGVAAWFTLDGRVGSIEERCDAYRLGGQSSRRPRVLLADARGRRGASGTTRLVVGYVAWVSGVTCTRVLAEAGAFCMATRTRRLDRW